MTPEEAYKKGQEVMQKRCSIIANWLEPKYARKYIEQLNIVKMDEAVPKAKHDLTGWLAENYLEDLED
jgi:hypothetical protein